MPLLVIQLWLPQTHAVPIESSLLNITASGITPAPPVSVDERSLQSAPAPALYTIEQTLTDSHLLNVSYVHHTPQGTDTVKAQNLDSGISPSTVNYNMISAIIAGLGLLLAFFKLYWINFETQMLHPTLNLSLSLARLAARQLE